MMMEHDEDNSRTGKCSGNSFQYISGAALATIFSATSCQDHELGQAVLDDCPTNSYA